MPGPARCAAGGGALTGSHAVVGSGALGFLRVFAVAGFACARSFVAPAASLASVPPWQHLVEIMKLLGTPTERELRAMRATCTSSDLPKLKPYPWERVFPSGTSARAIDLAHKLLCYDPSQRLTATQAHLRMPAPLTRPAHVPPTSQPSLHPQATAHPFFEGVQYMMAGAAHTSVLDLGHSQWQRHLQSVFDNYISSRTAESLEVVAALEASLVTALQASCERCRPGLHTPCPLPLPVPRSHSQTLRDTLTRSPPAHTIAH